MNWYGEGTGSRPLDRLDEEKQAAEKRLDELSAKVRKLFDSHTGGVIDDRNYEMLMTDIQSEQTGACRQAGTD